MPVVGPHVRRAVAEFLPNPDEHYREADLTIALTGEAWASLYLNQMTIAELVADGGAEIRKGSLEQGSALFELSTSTGPREGGPGGPAPARPELRPREPTRATPSSRTRP